MRFEPKKLKMNSRHHRKLLRKKKRRTALASRFFLHLALTLFFLSVIFYFLFLSPVFKIKETKIISPPEISLPQLQNIVEQELKEHFLYFFSKDSFFLIDSKKITKRLEKEIPEIKKSSLKRKFPDLLVLEIKKREPVAVWCYLDESKCFLIDEERVIFKAALNGGFKAVFPSIAESQELTSQEQKENFIEEDKIPNANAINIEALALALPLVISKDQEKGFLERVSSEKELSQILEIKNNFEAKLNIPIKNFTKEDKDFINVRTVEGWEAYFDLENDIKLSLTKLTLLLDKEISLAQRKNLQYIDLRFSKAYYK